MLRLFLFSALAAVAVLAAPAARSDAAPDPQARARHVLAQVDALDREIEQVAEAYDRAGVELARTRRNLRLNARALAVARRNLVRAEADLSRLLVARYEGGEASSTLQVLLGGTSLNDLIDRLDAVQRVGRQDALVLEQVRRFRTRVRVERQRLRRELAAKQQLRASLGKRRRLIEDRLADRRRLLASIRTEVERLRAQERARQLRLSQAAAARLSADARTAVQPIAAPVPTSPTGSPAAAAPGGGHPEAAGLVMRYLGVPYRWGGAAPSSGFDCSGLVLYVYAQIGIALPHNAAMQYGYGVPVDRGALLPGDIVFFNGLGHNGIYIGGGQFVDAPKTGDVVKIENLNDGYWSTAYVGARRLP